jgi:hypothetical protein
MHTQIDLPKSPFANDSADNVEVKIGLWMIFVSLLVYCVKLEKNIRGSIQPISPSPALSYSTSLPLESLYFDLLVLKVCFYFDRPRMQCRLFWFLVFVLFALSD